MSTFPMNMDTTGNIAHADRMNRYCCPCFVNIDPSGPQRYKKAFGRFFAHLNLRTGQYNGKVSRTSASGEKELGRAWQQLPEDQRNAYYLKARVQQRARDELQSQALNVEGTATSCKEDLSKGQQQRLLQVRLNKSLQDWPGGWAERNLQTNVSNRTCCI